MKKTTAMVVTVVAAVLAIVCSVLMCTLSTEGTIWGVCMLVYFVAMVVGLMNSLRAEIRLPPRTQFAFSIFFLIFSLCSCIPVKKKPDGSPVFSFL